VHRPAPRASDAQLGVQADGLRPPLNWALACKNVITESFVLLVQELVSSIAFKIAVRLKVGQHEQWKRMALEFFVFALLVIPLFFIFGWLFLQAVSWLL